MSRIKIYRFLDDEINEEELQKLIQESGCEVADDDSDAEVLVVILNSELSEHAALEGDLIRATGMGQRIVCVWPKETIMGVIPLAAEKYSSAQIAWNPRHLCDVVEEKSPKRYDDPTGEPRPKPHTDRNQC